MRGAILVGFLICWGTLAAVVAQTATEPSSAGAVEVFARSERNPSAQRMVHYTEKREPCTDYTATRRPLFGDLHVHTSFSFDAAAISIGATPEDAHRFAKGEAIAFWPLADGKPVGEYSLDRPLDFLAVTDHGEFLGERRLCGEPDSPSYNSEFCKQSRTSQRMGMILLGQVITTETPKRIEEVCGEDGALCREFARSPWHRMAATAESSYDKTASCKFTSFVAYEYTGTPGTSNYHRNVIFRNGRVPDLPVSYIDAPYDSMLWRKLDAACPKEEGCEYLTIPHNSNLANGRMAPYMRLEPGLANRQAYAAKRLQREPIMEVFQHKGGSECINGLSSVLAEPDELCDIEAVRVLGKQESFVTMVQKDGRMQMGTARETTGECGDAVGGNGMLGAGCVDETDFLRSGLLVGLVEEAEIGANPVKLGVIASTDTHAATPGAALEQDWRGHVSQESTPAQRLRPGLLTSGIDGNPGGLAGVWAVENSRDAIFEAMLRREVFGTSGPRIVPRFFAGWDYDDDLCQRADLAEAGYAGGVPMGGDLAKPPAATSKPVFIASALRDPSSQAADLQQLQLVKGWIDAQGKMRSTVVSIAGDAKSSAGVNLETGERFGKGHASLCTVFQDRSFDPQQPAYYYLRVVENPSARWSFFDCRRLPEDERPKVCTDGSYPEVIQEMAWSSPIWYRPQPAEATGG